MERSKLKQVKKELAFAKGHATENDFIIIDDPEGDIELSPRDILRLCDRHAGIGADGILRVVKASRLGEPLTPEVDPDWWFMDYRNADGSLAEMCGNGVRLFAHWLHASNLVDSTDFSIGTRAGARQVAVLSQDDDAQVSVRVDMGPATVTGVSTCQIPGAGTFAGLGVNVGNPHLACVVPRLTAAALGELDLQQPVFDSGFFPEGVNVEILTALVDGAVDMRVWERGVGETRSCGTGTVAAALAALADAGQVEGTVRVRVPGGVVSVEIQEAGSTLTGPSVIVARGVLTL